MKNLQTTMKNFRAFGIAILSMTSIIAMAQENVQPDGHTGATTHNPETPFQIIEIL